MYSIEGAYDVIVDQLFDVLRPHEVHMVEDVVVYQGQTLQITHFLRRGNHYLHNIVNKALETGLCEVIHFFQDWFLLVVYTLLILLIVLHVIVTLIQSLLFTRTSIYLYCTLGLNKYFMDFRF